MISARPPTPGRHTPAGCVFLPLTAEATDHAVRSTAAEETRGNATLVRARVAEVEAAANTCWNALLAGCDSAGRSMLSPRLRRLSEATSQYGGSRWWFTDGAAYRRRVASAQSQIEDAIAEGDGQEFAKAFVGYDHAMAGAVVCAQRRTRQPSTT